MERGKEICKALKEIRRRIATENDIEFITSECKHKGDCLGTCPKCEAEVRYLEEQLEARKRLGKTSRVVGLSIGLAAIAPALFTDCRPSGYLVQGDVPMPEEQTEAQDTTNQGQTSASPLEGDIADPEGQN